MYCNIAVMAISYLAKCIKRVLLEFLPLLRRKAIRNQWFVAKCRFLQVQSAHENFQLITD